MRSAAARNSLCSRRSVSLQHPRRVVLSQPERVDLLVDAFAQLSDADLLFGAIPPRGQVARDVTVYLKTPYAEPSGFFIHGKSCIAAGLN